MLLLQGRSVDYWLFLKWVLFAVDCFVSRFVSQAFTRGLMISVSVWCTRVFNVSFVPKCPCAGWQDIQTQELIFLYIAVRLLVIWRLKKKEDAKSNICKLLNLVNKEVPNTRRLHSTHKKKLVKPTRDVGSNWKSRAEKIQSNWVWIGCANGSCWTYFLTYLTPSCFRRGTGGTYGCGKKSYIRFSWKDPNASVLNRERGWLFQMEGPQTDVQSLDSKADYQRQSGPCVKRCRAGGSWLELLVHFQQHVFTSF